MRRPEAQIATLRLLALRYMSAEQSQSSFWGQPQPQARVFGIASARVEFEFFQ